MQPINKKPRWIEGVVTAGEAREQIRCAREQGFTPAIASYPPRYRNNDRLVRDDPALAARLFQRLQPHLPPSIVDDAGEEWQLAGLNSRFRFCRYRSGQQFTRHRDGAHWESNSCRSFLTAMVYLNDACEFEGGATRFYPDRDAESVPDQCFQPRRGAVALFRHDLWHDGAPVAGGEKYIMRTDVMYRSRRCVERQGHRGYVWDLTALESGLVASAGRDRSIRVWRGRVCKAVLSGHSLSVTALGSGEGDRIWSGSRDGELRIWQRRGNGWATERSIAADGGAVVSITDEHRGRFATGSADGIVCVWSAAGGLLQRHKRHDSWVWGLTWDDEGGLWSAAEDGVVVGRDRLVGVGRAIRSLVWQRGELYAGDGGGTISRYSLSLQLLGSWQAHGGAITALCALPGGHIASASEDDTVRIWQTSSAASACWQHGDFVRCLTVDSNGQLWSGGYDGEVRVLPWRASVGERVTGCSTELQRLQGGGHAGRLSR